MRFIFLPKHQRLVNQCYPNGRTTDKKAKSSETAYLLYYVNSRRSKLEKVSSFLKKRTNADINRRRVGNISVTLELMNKIVKNCKENLNIFIRDFFSIMGNILANSSLNNDTSLIELIELVFGSICSNIDGTLYNGDVEFTRYFSSFIDSFLKVIKDRIHNDDLLLKWCIDISQVANLSSTPKLNNYVSEAVNITLTQFQERNPRFRNSNLVQRPSKVNEQLLNKRLSRTQTRFYGLDSVDDSVSDLSLKALQSFFNTTETDKLNLSLRGLLDFLQLIPNSDLLEFVCNGIPVQLRYIVILLLIRQLIGEQDADIKNKVDPIICLRLMSSLLSSDVSIVGLSIIDIMRKLIEFQLKNYKDSEITTQCRYTIRDIGFKAYYKGQTTDMLFELVGRMNILDLNLHDHDNKDSADKHTKEDDEDKRAIIIQDIKEITKYKKEPCISLELFLELVQYSEDSLINLFKLVDNQIPGIVIFSRLFRTICGLQSNQRQETLLELVFEKYGKYALFSGLKYFFEETKEDPDYTYYAYHRKAAEFLSLEDYKSQTEYRSKKKILFTKEDLLNYYSDPGSNKYSQKGIQILMSKNHMVSSSDLTSENLLHPTTADGFDNTTTILSNNQTASDGLRNLKIRAKRSRQNTDNSANISTKASIYKYVSDETRSLKSMRNRTPKVSELKSAIGSKSQKHLDKHDEKRDSLTFRGSQSVKSRITDITFLLSELKSTDIGNETSKIRDIDEEEIIGLDKIDIARSQASKIIRHNSSMSTDKRKSYILKTILSNSKRNDNDFSENQDEEDEFKDATEDVQIMDTRGMLFTTS